MSKHFFILMESPVGEIAITSNGKAITGIYTPEHPDYKKAKRGAYEPGIFKDAVNQLQQYFNGKRSNFALPLEPEGSEFQKRVWNTLSSIAYGKTKSYGDIAKSLGRPKAARAVGMASGKNPLSIIVPCHRVIGKNGKLTGYAGGIKTKEWLLNHEKAV